VAKRQITTCPSCGQPVRCDNDPCTVQVVVNESAGARRTAIDACGRIVHYCEQRPEFN
jgi:hypothetical protein